MSTLKKPFKKGFRLAGSKTQVLLLHGFTGAPYDLHPLAYFLNSHDCHVSVPLLKGHGKKAHNLDGVVAEDWLKQAYQELELFDADKPWVVGGLSMGALLAVMCAAKYPSIRACLLFSVAFSLGWMAEATILAVKLGLVPKKTLLPKMSGGSDIFFAEAKAKTPALKEMPAGGLIELEKLRKDAIDAIATVKCPIYAAFGSHDAAIDAQASHSILLEKVSSPFFCRFYENAKHVITLDYDRDKVAADLWQFIKPLVKESS